MIAFSLRPGFRPPLRGKFDYASLSTDDLNGARRFSILVMSENHGALVKEAKPPAR